MQGESHILETELIQHFPEVPLVPFMSPQKFSEMTGYPLGVIQGWINKGYLPVYPDRLGKYVPINLVELHHRAAQGLRNDE